MKALLKKVSTALLVPVMALAIAGVGPAAVYAQTTTPATPNCEDVSGAGISTGAQCAKPDSAPAKLFGQNSIFVTVTNILLFIIGAIAVIMLIVGGIRYVVSSGDQTAVTSAKNTILYAIIGIIVAFLAYAAVNFISTQLVSGTTTP